MSELTRRDFAGGASLATALSYSRVLGANDRVRMGYIGVGNRGAQVHDDFLEFGDQQTVAVCDLRDDYMDFAVQKSRAQPKKYKEYRKLLDDKDVDAVVIATPDHWHALMFIDACNAGKDVYVEKPLCTTVVEGRRMVDTAARTKRVVQVGTGRRSSKAARDAAEFVRNGGIGQVTVAKSYHIMNDWPVGIGNPPDEPPPDAWTWDQWVGPAPMTPYNRNRTYYNFRWFYEYSGGQLTNFGVHHIDMIRWCLGKDAPRAVTAMGGKYAVKDNRAIPDTMEVLWEFDGPTLVVFSQYNCSSAPGNVPNAEIELRGTKGVLYLLGNRWEVVPEKVSDAVKTPRTPLDRVTERSYGASRKSAMEAKVVQMGRDTAAHARNFLDCIKTRGKCNADILTGHLSTSATLIAGIAHRTESYLKWDSRAERFTNNEAANRHLTREYRAPYKLG
ncbi:MAG: Gfo/Idh/MocA family oxidoreductase [Bryobacterales bacterium]|nr:Gfo/Idh/MocA family oxidoreductase [Bryobacterales bacterium]